MIIMRLIGGMGNQMFQYAAAKAIAKRLGTELLLDLYSYDKIYRKIGRHYTLGCFNPPERVATLRDIARLFPFQAIAYRIKGDASSAARVFLWRVFRFITNLRAVLREDRVLKKTSDTHLTRACFCRVYREVDFPPYFLDIPDNVYMMGYFESEKFWRGLNEEDIFSMFSFDVSFFENPLLNEIRATQSVSIHIRRGDKVIIPDFQPSKLEYIKQALQIIYDKISHPSFFVFSDDIAWCKIHLPTVVGSDAPLRFVESESAQEDLFLMSQCKHNIVGPSTFSWWGAYLNTNPEKTVIAPHMSLWYDSQREDLKDCLPKSWIVLSRI